MTIRSGPKNGVSTMKRIRDLELEDLDMVSLPDDIKWIIMKWFIMKDERLTSLYDVNWIWISFHNELSESFIEKHMDVLVIGVICECQPLSESFMERYIDVLDMELISKYQTLSESFMERHMDMLDMTYVSKYQTLSESFIERHVDALYKPFILEYQDISPSFRVKLEHLINS